jgi:hypothetical protein
MLGAGILEQDRATLRRHKRHSQIAVHRPGLHVAHASGVADVDRVGEQDGGNAVVPQLLLYSFQPVAPQRSHIDLAGAMIGEGSPH